MTPDISPFDDFWQASSLDRFNLRDFAQQLNSYNADDKELTLAVPHKAVALPRAKTRTARIGAKRASVRDFGPAALSPANLGDLLGPLGAHDGPEHRGYPSAGASYATEVFVVGFNADGPGELALTGSVAYYDPEHHGLSVLHDHAPSWDDAQPAINATVTGTPGALIVVTTFAERVTAKYGERGGRFALLEAGAAMQQLSLAVAEDKRLNGVVVGGLLDAFWKDALGLADTDARIVVGYLVGRAL